MASAAAGLVGTEDSGVSEISSTGGGGTVISPTQIGGLTRFYEKEFPEVEDLVVVNVRNIADMGAYVHLREYNNIEGMILLSELSRRRIRSINRLLRVGHDEVVMVIRVDKEKGYIDLSKRRVAAEDIVKAEEKYGKSKAVHAVVRHVSSRLKVPIASLLQRVAWPLYKKYGHAYDAFQVAVTDPDAILSELDITPEERAELTTFIKAKMTPQPMRIRADIQVTCFTYAGIEAIREALSAAQKAASDKVPIKLQLIAPPLYVMLTNTLDKEAGIAALTSAIAEVKAVIEARGGQLNVKMPPTVTSSRDDSELMRMLADLEMANQDVSGDEDSDEDEDEDDDYDDADGGDGAGEDATASAAAPPAAAAVTEGKKGKGKRTE